MALTEKRESKTIRVNSVNENGSDVLSIGATYSPQNISISVEMFDQAYCEQNKADVQNAITAFLTRLNRALAEDGFPLVQTH